MLVECFCSSVDDPTKSFTIRSIAEVPLEGDVIIDGEDSYEVVKRQWVSQGAMRQKEFVPALMVRKI